MSTTILYVRTTTRTSPGAILAGAADPARAIAAVPGLIWKVWVLDEVASELGGVYLFAGHGSKAQFADPETVQKQAAMLKKRLDRLHGEGKPRPRS